MKEELARVAEQGYAVNDEELLPGYLVIAAPVLDATARTVTAISITLPVDHTHPEHEISHAALLIDAASRTSLLLGYNRLSSAGPCAELSFLAANGKSLDGCLRRFHRRPQPSPQAQTLAEPHRTTLMFAHKLSMLSFILWRAMMSRRVQ
jgi:hypothetical protein